jgi:HK97 family phage prohead protease
MPKTINNGDNLQITAGITIKAVPSVLETRDEILFKDLVSDTTKAKDALTYGQVEVIVSNSALDRHGEIIEMNGIDTKQVMRNPVVMWGHQYSELPIGRILKLWKKDGNLMARIELDYDIYDFADTVYKMILKGTINAVSIGGIVRDWEYDEKQDLFRITKLEMVELSVVPVGAHPDALVTAKSLGMQPQDIKKQYEDFMRKSLVDKFKSIPQNELNNHIKALKTLIAALETSAEEATTDSAESPKQTDKSKTVKKLIIVRQAAKQIDKQSEIIISAINKQLNLVK